MRMIGDDAGHLVSWHQATTWPLLSIASGHSDAGHLVQQRQARGGQRPVNTVLLCRLCSTQHTCDGPRMNGLEVPFNFHRHSLKYIIWCWTGNYRPGWSGYHLQTLHHPQLSSNPVIQSRNRIWGNYFASSNVSGMYLDFPRLAVNHKNGIRWWVS